MAIKPQSMTESIYKIWLPAAIRYGIPYETFWVINPRIMELYQNAKKDDVERQQKIIDYTGWLNGMYVTRAISSCFSKRGRYPNQPISLNEERQELSDEEKFKIWIAEHNRKFDEQHIGE